MESRFGPGRIAEASQAAAQGVQGGGAGHRIVDRPQRFTGEGGGVNVIPQNACYKRFQAL